MKVILTADVYKHGVAGEVVRVADGYARNYLIPQGLAVQATSGALKQSTRLRETAKTRKAELENKLNELARQIDGTELFFGRRAGANGKLYGSVTSMEMADALLEKTGVDLNRRRISQQALRELGEHEVVVRLGSGENPILRVFIVREEELEDFVAARERGEDAAIEDVSPDSVDFDEAPELAGEAIQELVEEAAASVEAVAAVTADTEAGEATDESEA